MRGHRSAMSAGAQPWHPRWMTSVRVLREEREDVACAVGGAEGRVESPWSRSPRRSHTGIPVFTRSPLALSSRRVRIVCRALRRMRAHTWRRLTRARPPRLRRSLRQVRKKNKHGGRKTYPRAAMGGPVQVRRRRWSSSWDRSHKTSRAENLGKIGTKKRNSGDDLPDLRTRSAEKLHLTDLMGV